MAKTVSKRVQPELDETAADAEAVVEAAVESDPEPEVTGEQIAERAYYIFLERGGTEESALEDWLQAERELRNKQI